MDDKIAFSVIIPLYNKETEIHRAVRSVLQQTIKNFELIIVDDGSTDNSLQKAQEMKNDKIKIFTKKNGGVSSARNFGIKKSRYDYIAFLDADDEWKPDFLKTIHNLIFKFPQAGLFATSYEIVNINGKKKTNQFRTIPPPPWEGIITSYFHSACIEAIVWTSAVVIPRTVIDKVGDFPKNITVGEDKDLWERVALEYPISYNASPLATYYHDSSNRACLKYATTIRNRPFFKIANDAINENKLEKNLLKDLKEYLDSCKILQADIFIKHIMNNHEGRKLLKATSPNIYSLKKKKLILYVLSFIPSKIIIFFWKIKQKIK